MANKQPVFYIPHGGGPWPFMDWPAPDPWQGLEVFLRGFAATLVEAPRAVLVVSGHWEADPVAVNVQDHPPLLFDYYGFPPDTYRLKYPAPGAPALAAEVAQVLQAAGIPTARDDARGFDHGVFIPFMLMYPQADMPILQVSLKAGLSAAENLALGAALAPLRERGVLIVGSGMSFHNLRVRSPTNTPFRESELFDAALGEVVCAADPQQRDAGLVRWEQLPAARFAHPREEHLLPLMVAAGAAGTDRGVRIFNDVMMGWRISGFRFGWSAHQ